MNTTLEKLRLAQSQAINTSAALVDSLPDSNNVIGDVISDLIRRAYELKRDIQRLADCVEFDLEEWQ